MKVMMLTGNLGRDAELRGTQGGTLCKFSVAHTDKGRDGERTEWVNCAIFGKRAEALCKYLTKGTRVAISGKHSVREFDKKDGSRGYSEEIEVHEITLMGGGEKREGRRQESNGGGFEDKDYGPTEDIPF